jgi:CarD family transcriptional regulator
VHPHHGAGLIVSRRRRRLVGAAARNYLEIELAHRSLRISVPCDAVGAVGLRAVASRSGLRQIAEVLEGEAEAVTGSWSARRRHYRAKLKKGDVLSLAAVARDLALRHAESDLPATERDLYERSRQILTSELGYALGANDDGAGAYIDQHVRRIVARRVKP